MKKLRITLSALLSLSVAMLATAAFADPDGANEAPVRITDVRFTDLNDPTQIEIVGARFDNGDAPIVTLGENPITVHGSTAALIQAELPGNTPNGDYTVGVSTGPGTKQNAEHTLNVAPLIPMSVGCLDWFITGGHNEHIHNEIHVIDDLGLPVLGATVTYTTAWDGDVFQTNVSATTKTAGHNHGEGCSDPTGSGVTGWFCCIGAGKFDAGGEVPGGRSCPAGDYSVEVLSVEPPAGTPMVWDEVQPDGNTVFFAPK